MSTNTDENAPSNYSDVLSGPSTVNEHENVITRGEPDHLTAESELVEDKQSDIKTIESQENDIIEDEQANTKRSRELKLLLALSKEANLDVNISHKRKSLDSLKLREISLAAAKLGLENESIMKKSKVDKFPITAECEIESIAGESNNALDNSNDEKIKKEDSKGKDGFVIEERKNIKDVKVFKPNKDKYCWRCHREGVNISCETCPRSYHQKCLKQTISDANNWPCPECVAILKAESTQTRSPAMRGMTLEHLCSLLKFAVKRMIECNGSDPFHHPVNDKLFPEYKKYIIQPMNLTSLEKNIKENLYGSTQAFEADAKWILHNSIIFNSYQSKLTTNAKMIIKICKQEMAEIENCPSCYLNANTKKSTWFVEVCPKPHILVWAKLKGFPYWPAKAMCTNNSGMVDVRFFGAHDRAWVPSKECFLYSRRDPNSNKQKRNDIIECMREVEVYIANIKSLYGEFNYAPFKLQYDPDNELKQLLLFIPRYRPNAPPPKKRIKIAETKAKPRKEKNDEKEEIEPKEDNKEILEGYGTDDETLESDALDTTKRKLLLQQEPSAGQSIEKEESDSSSSEEVEEEQDNLEPELDDDTQVSSNLLEDKMPREAVKTRGGINTSPGELKIIRRRISEESISRKRLSSDELSPPSKIARRNSDQSIKSDSSRLSSLSDKINRVDISENVELTLGNTADGYITSSTGALEIRKKPIQVDVDNSELTISPQSKTKIAERLTQKLSSSDEDVSNDEMDKIGSDSKLQTDIILERYKDLVKKKSMEFYNVEASTSFGTTSVVSKGICVVSSDDVIENKSDERIDSIDEVNSILDTSIENGNEKSNRSEKSTKNAMDISSTENLKNYMSGPESGNIGNSSDTRSASLDEEQKEEGVMFEMVTKNDERVNSLSVSRVEIKNSFPSKNADSNNEENDSMNIDNEKTTPKIVEKKIHTEAEIKEMKESEVSENRISEKQSIKSSITKSKEEITIQNIEKAKVLPVLQVKNNAAVINNIAHLKQTEFNPNVNNDDKVVKDNQIHDETIPNEFEIVTRIDSKKIITYSRKDRKSTEVKRKDSPVIEQPVDSNSSDEQELVLDDTQIDETNIRNIIHSSLNNVASTKKIINETINDEGKVLKRKSPPSPEDTSHKKIKCSKEEKKPNFKIVPIQHILNKNIDRKSPEPSVIRSNPILLKKLSQPPGVTTPATLECVEIKSEPDSEEDLQETQYMEAKRQYMSALNISEKTEDLSIPKKNEIRTRSKTEEMGKEKLMDNLSKVIEEVATTFSAKHETQKKIVERKINNPPPATPQAAEERRKAPTLENGEIFVKSFAKMAQQPQPPVRIPQQRPQPSQKPKPCNSVKTTIVQSIRREVPSKPNIESIQTKLTRITSTPISHSNTPNTNSTSATSTNKTIESLGSSGNVLILTQPGVILPTSQQLTYNPGYVTFVPSPPNMAMMQTPQVINAVMAPNLHQNETVQQPHRNTDLNRSQNYIPQNEEQVADNTNRPISAQTVVNSNNNIGNHLQNRDIPSLIPINDSERNTAQTPGNNATEARAESTDDEFSLLRSMVPEAVSKAISEVLCRPPPKLRPRPPGPLSQVFDSGNPSSAGPVSAKINSISHRLGDYFRGMLVEMLEDLGKVNNTEATIASLKHEIETLQHKHASEITDIRKNICAIFKDIQGSIVADRERLVDETRSACEVEALRRIEEAKSKQWCANCGKEAQFYCCWNTSYCDYSCQIKQWSKHMSKCTQHAGQSQPGQSPAVRPQSQLTFRPATAKTFSGRLVAKPTKVYLNRSTNSKSIPTFKSGTGGHLALVDTSNLEFLTNTPRTKFIATSSLFTRVRNVISTVTSPSNGTKQIETPNQKVDSSGPVVRASPSTSNIVSNVISDEEMDSD